jgi:hypothetical protein
LIRGARGDLTGNQHFSNPNYKKYKKERKKYKTKGKRDKEQRAMKSSRK